MGAHKDVVSHGGSVAVQPPRFCVLTLVPIGCLEPPIAIMYVFEGLAFRKPSVHMISCVGFATLLLDSLMREIHPLRQSRCVLFDWYRFFVHAIDAEIELGEVNKATWPNRQCNVIDEAFVIANLD